MPTALVHDYLLVMRGAERTFAAIADCWPSADIYTLLYDPAGTDGRFADRRVTSSYLRALRLRQHSFRRALPLFPRAAASLSLRDYDVVVSSSSAFAHGVTVAPDAVHVCYCHSPFRYAWHEQDRACSEVPTAMRPLLRHVLRRVRDWDLHASQAVTHYVANSRATQQRIQDFYARDSTVIYPPVDVARFSIGKPEDYALIVSEMIRHKRVDVALEAARRAGQRVKVVGTGPDLDLLSRRFGESAEFLGRVSDAELARLYAGARAFVMANVEEFGIAAVEAQAAGRPVVATSAGGATETVVPGETGVLVPENDIDAFAEALRYTDFDRFSPEKIRSHAMRFSVANFATRLRTEVAHLTGDVCYRREPQGAISSVPPAEPWEFVPAAAVGQECWPQSQGRAT